MTDEREEAARGVLLTAVKGLEEIGVRLSALQATLPVSPQETGPTDLDRNPDTATEIRTVILNVLTNCLQPAIEDLRAAAAYRPGRAVEGPALDLQGYSEETKDRLYDLVVEHNFKPKRHGEPGDSWVPPYTPEQAELDVFFEWGRWFASWQKLELPETCPEADRCELVRIVPGPAGTILYQNV